jgi:hypothetical protein
MYIFVLLNLFVPRQLRKPAKKYKKFLHRIWFLESAARGFLREQSYDSTGWEGRFCDGGHGCWGGLRGHRNRRAQVEAVA